MNPDSTTIDWVSVIETEGHRAWTVVPAASDRVIPWSDGWTVAECGLHLASTHQTVARILAGRPHTDFAVSAQLDIPAADDEALAGWAAQGTQALVSELRAVDTGTAVWSPWPTDRTAGFWGRRMAHETLVHRWDLEAGAGSARTPLHPALAADGVDEFLSILAHMARARRNAPGAGESIEVHCTDVDGDWRLDCTAPGKSELLRGRITGDMVLRGPAEGLLLYLWGRGSAANLGVEKGGDATLWARWRELVPPI